MTRLVSEDVAGLAEQWSRYERDFRQTSGVDLVTVAATAVGLDPVAFKKILTTVRVSVVTITTGEGEIGGFGLAVAEIAGFMGFPTRLAAAPDVAGLAEAVQDQADLVLCSDDDYFGALNFKKGRVGENSWATGLGYAEMLGYMAQGLKEKTVHLTGAGPVGRAAAAHLDSLGAVVVVHDHQDHLSGQLAARLKRGRAGTAEELVEAQKSGGLFFQAAPDPRALDWQLLDPASSLVVHPAVPLGLPDKERPGWRGRLWFDPLQLGTAVMLAAAC